MSIWQSILNLYNSNTCITTFTADMISLPTPSHRNAYYLILHLLVISILFSKAGISICIGLLLCLSLFRISRADSWWLHPNRAFLSAFRMNPHKWLYLSLMLLYGLTLLSGANSENTADWLHFVKIKAPYLLLPIICLNHPPIERKMYRSLLLTLILCVLISSVGVMSYYAIHMLESNEQISSGKSLDTPLTHVKFSVLLAMSIISASALALQNKLIWSRHWRLPLYIIIGFLFVTIHVLSARTGLLTLYAVGGPMLLVYFWKQKRYRLIALVSLMALSAPFIAYHTIPSFYHKYHYMKHDLQMMKEGKADNYSDGERLRSISIGLTLWKENPLLGTGIGDLRDRCEQEYTEHYPLSTKKIMPHNQYVMYLAAYGLLGLVLFLLCFAYPITRSASWQNPHLIGLFFILLIYGLVEKPLDEYVFITVHALWFSLGISVADSQDESLAHS